MTVRVGFARSVSSVECVQGWGGRLTPRWYRLRSGCLVGPWFRHELHPENPASAGFSAFRAAGDRPVPLDNHGPGFLGCWGRFCGPRSCSSSSFAAATATRSTPASARRSNRR